MSETVVTMLLYVSLFVPNRITFSFYALQNSE